VTAAVDGDGLTLELPPGPVRVTALFREALTF
jgi:hypothetical protein